MKKLFFLATLLLINSISVQSQQLNVGDLMPDLKGQRFFKDGKYTDMDLNMSALKDKLIIFDFWAPTCSSCIAGFPKMDSLQKKFGDKIWILPIVQVNRKNEGEIAIANFWLKNAYSKRSTSLGTFVETNDNKFLYKYFPNASLPYEVWIKNGKVLALTAPEYVNEKEITSILAGEKKDWATLQVVPGEDNVYDFNIPLPVYMAGTKKTSLPEKSFYGVAGGFIPDVVGTSQESFANNGRNFNKLTFINYTILDLYRKALLGYRKVQETEHLNWKSHTIFEVNNISDYVQPVSEYDMEWLKKHAYCYELVLPSSYTKEATYTFMRDDLNRFFGLNGRLEKRKVKCWIITRNSNKPGFTKGLVKKIREEHLANSEKMGQVEYMAYNDEKTKQRGYKEGPFTSISSLVTNLNVNYSGINCPVLDESGYKGELEFLFKYGPSVTFENYKQQLSENGFDLNVGEWEVEMLVITENGYGKASK